MEVEISEMGSREEYQVSCPNIYHQLAPFTPPALPLTLSKSVFFPDQVGYYK